MFACAGCVVRQDHLSPNKSLKISGKAENWTKFSTPFQLGSDWVDLADGREGKRGSKHRRRHLNSRFRMLLHKANSLLSAEQVSDLSGLSTETLAQWRSQKRGIPYLKIGRCVRHDAQDVQSYLARLQGFCLRRKRRRQNG
jgi:hypothetical protein